MKTEKEYNCWDCKDKGCENCSFGGVGIQYQGNPNAPYF